MTAKDLKNAFLQEAVQGKLVPQIASEGNAKELLEEIRKEKAKLVKEGKLKKEKPLPEISEEDIPFDIPENWCWCRFGNICSVITCGYASTPTYVSSEEGMPFLSAKNIKPFRFMPDNHNYISKELYSTLTKYAKPEKGDILLTRVGAGIGEAAIIDRDLDFAIYVSLTLIKLINNKLIDNKFVLYWLSSPIGISTAIQNIYGKEASQGNLNVKNVREFCFPLPPLAEQKRIVAAIEKFMPLIEEYGKKETELKAFNEQIGTLTKKAILQEAVQGKLVPQIAAEGNAKDLLEEIKKEKAKLTKEGKIKKEKPLPEISEDEIPFDIPENWCWCRLGGIVNYKMGKTPPRAESEWWGDKNDIPWISIADMIADGHINSTKEFMSQKAIKEVFNNTVSKAGTLIMSFKLTVGRVSILDIDATHNEAIISIYPYIDSDYCTRNYLFKVLPLLSQNGETKDAIKGRTLNSTSLSNMLIPFPPLAEQKRIVAAIEKMLPLCENLGE